MSNDEINPGSDQVPRPRAYTTMIEVQFRKGTQMEVAAAPGAACAFSSVNNALAVADLNTFIQQQGCQKAERVFDDEPPENIAGAGHPASMDEVDAPDLSGFYVLHFPEDSNVQAIAKKLQSYPGVEHAAPLPMTKFASAPVPQRPKDELLFPVRDESRDFQWYIKHCQVFEAWDLGYTGKGVVIADVDSGFQTDHPDLKGRFNLARAFNTATNDDQLSESGDNLAHGTKVAGQIGAAANGDGLVGIAHDAELWPIEVGPAQIFEPVPQINAIAWAKAIHQVIKFMRTETRRVVVVIEGQTLSNGNITQIGMIRQAVLSAIARGAVVCVAAGNGDREVSETDCDRFIDPCCHGEIFKPAGIIVGATDFDDKPYKDIVSKDATNFGDVIVVCAPGDPLRDLTCANNLASDFPYTSIFGATSGATAKVAGAIALMLQANDQLNNSDVEEIFRQTGKPINSPDKPLGRLLNCKEAVLMAQKMAQDREPIAAD